MKLDLAVIQRQIRTKWPWYLGSSIGLLTAIIILIRRSSTVGSNVIANVSVKDEIFKAILPVSGRQFADVILRVAREENVNPFLLAAIMARESAYGTTLKPTGPGGTGDWSSRSGKMPPDGQGWGRGLMQIDFNSWKEWLTSNNWKDPYTNIRKGSQILKSKMTYLENKGVSGNLLLKATVAAYNCGEGRAWKLIQEQKDVDSGTTGGNYSTSVLASAAGMQKTARSKV